eukprot:m.238657 g.238657  ORF g.238657 m.238657 type:complete len:200 (+) comp54360_c1_seq12:319-918(+)
MSTPLSLRSDFATHWPSASAPLSLAGGPVTSTSLHATPPSALAIIDNRNAGSLPSLAAPSQPRPTPAVAPSSRYFKGRARNIVSAEFEFHKLEDLPPVSDCHGGLCNAEQCRAVLFRATSRSLVALRLRHPDWEARRATYLRTQSRRERRRHDYPQRAREYFEQFLAGSLSEADIVDMEQVVRVEYERLLSVHRHSARQ